MKKVCSFALEGIPRGVPILGHHGDDGLEDQLEEAYLKYYFELLIQAG